MAELDRRDFLKLVGASAGAAAAAGCSDPVERLVPYVIQPEQITPGIAVTYASTCRECPAACGLHVTTREGRPIKLEGNPDHPINRGRLCARGQAGLARTYHPDRYEGPGLRNGEDLETVTWEAGVRKLAERINALRQQGAISKLRVLGGSRGPALDDLIDDWLRAMGADPATQRLIDEPFADGALRRASQLVFGSAGEPVFDLSEADLVVEFGSDFLDSGSSPTEHAAQFAAARDVAVHADGGARLVSVGARMNLTVSNADEWLPARAGHEGPVAMAVARLVLERLESAGRPVPGDAAAAARSLTAVNVAQVARDADLETSVLERLADQLVEARSPVALPPGVSSRSTSAVDHSAAVLLLNALLGAPGVSLPERTARPAAATLEQLRGLVSDMERGEVDVLIVHDANPVYSLSPELGFVEALASVPMVVSLAPLMDETSERASLVLPDHTPMESWGDAEPRAGVRGVIQPSVRPLLDTQSLGDTLLAVGRAMGDDVGTRLPSGSFRKFLESRYPASQWRDILAGGGVFGQPAAKARPEIAASAARIRAVAPALEGSGDLTLVAYARQFHGDGSGATLPWMQETPDPVTKASWVSWAEISLATAERLGVTFGSVVRVETGFGAEAVEVPAYPRGGVRDDVVAIAIGQGHTVGYYASRAGARDPQPGVARGVNVLSILPARADASGARAFLSATATASGTGAFHRIPISQWTDNQHDRSLAPAVSVVALGHDDHGGHGDEHRSAGNVARSHFEHTERGLISPFDPAVDAAPDEPYRWSMVIDNDRCTGCSACVVACAMENNSPSVGEEYAVMHREMTWIRIERYVGDGSRQGGAARRGWPDGEELGKTDIRHVPMLCQHCGAAPCESVCPVLATYHTPQGLNGMVYNRCVGTRYCANNCTYKVRRFNYRDYSQEQWPGLLGMMLNPDVTVRGQGVMEKCTFCVQRIQKARQPAKDQGRPIADGEVVTACQQTCPTGAITFGNARDPQSQVVKRADDPTRSYVSLVTLNTRPAITYLAQVTRDDHGESHG